MARLPITLPRGLHSNLRLQHVVVKGNRVTGGRATGGGIFTRDPIAVSETQVRGNRPNDCTGRVGAVTASVASPNGMAERDGSGQQPFTEPLVAHLLQHKAT
jgi:hypothetical protein